MAKKVEHLFTAEERERIAAAVKTAEQHTAGEIVPCIVAQCDEYEEAAWRGGAIAAFLVFAAFFCLRAFTTAWLPLGLGAMGAGMALAGGAGMLLVQWVPAFRRLQAGEELMDRRVTGRALQAFVEEEVFATRERTGILIFLSLLEHEVRVLGDAGINARVAQEEWEEVVRRLAECLRQGRPAEGLVEAVSRCGVLLERFGVQRRADDTDELGNTPRTGGGGRGMKTLLALVLCLLPLAAPALEVPPLRARVNDTAALLSPGTAVLLESLLKAHEDSTSNQVTLLTIPSLEGEGLERFRMRVVEQWQLGQAKKDNGVLLLVARDDREVRIEVGGGLEGLLPDITCGRIIRNEIVPRFRDGDYEGGILRGTGAILAAIGGVYPAEAPAGEGGSAGGGWSGDMWWLVVAGLVVFAKLVKSALFTPGLAGGSI